MVIKKRYTVKEAKVIAADAGYELVDMEGWGDRFYTIYLNGEARVQGQKLASLMQWIADNPLPTEVVEEAASDASEAENSSIVLTDSEKAIASQILKTVFGADYDASQIIGLRVYETTVHVITTVGGLWSLGRDYFKQLVLRFKAAVTQVKRQVKAVVKTVVQLSDRLWEVIGTTGNSYLIHDGATQPNLLSLQGGSVCCLMRGDRIHGVRSPLLPYLLLVIIIHQFARGVSQAIPFPTGVVIDRIIEAEEVAAIAKQLME